MYIRSITLKNLRTFTAATIDFLYPGVQHKPKPRYPNVNLLLGDNGSGKTTLLRALALAAMGPAVEGSGIFAYDMIRNIDDTESFKGEAVISAEIILHQQDAPQLEIPPQEEKTLSSFTRILRKGDIEKIRFREVPQDEPLWKGIYSSDSDAYFFVGYGATRRIEAFETFDIGARRKTRHIRAQRVQGLFEESYSLIPLTSWLPALQTQNPERFERFREIIDKIQGKDLYRFTGEQRNADYLFEKNGIKIPFQAMSDGYRGFLGWVTDLLYHIHTGCPPGKDISEMKGVVLIDEVDLHFHPSWQMNIVKNISKLLPNIQFFFSTHSPLVTGSLEWMNIIYMKAGKNLTTKIEKKRHPIHGLDADQLLLTPFFGLSSTRASSRERRLKELTLKARDGDKEAAKELLLEMSRGMEHTK